MAPPCNPCWYTWGCVKTPYLFKLPKITLSFFCPSYRFLGWQCIGSVKVQTKLKWNARGYYTIPHVYTYTYIITKNMSALTSWTAKQPTWGFIWRLLIWYPQSSSMECTWVTLLDGRLQLIVQTSTFKSDRGFQSWSLLVFACFLVSLSWISESSSVVFSVDWNRSQGLTSCLVLLFQQDSVPHVSGKKNRCGQDKT
jgi:hypothetical protein